jgi:transposase
MIKPKKQRIVNGKALIVTVDIGKDKHFGYWRCPDGTDVKPFLFLNNGSGFSDFWERISRAKMIYHLEEIVFGYESTGPYAEALVHFMKARGVRLVQVNPMHTKRVKELQGNSPNKTDQKDPKIIADIIELGHVLTVVIPEGSAAELRRLTHARERNVERHTALTNQLQALIAIIFPEFLLVIKDVRTVTARYLLQNYPTPQNLAACGLDNLTTMIKKMSRSRLREDCAKALYEAAKASIGVVEGQSSIILEIQAILAALKASEGFTEVLENEMSHHLRQIPYSNSLLSIKGIGEVTAAGLIGEVGDFRKFSTMAEIMKLAGLDLFEVSSGKHQGIRRISKRGRPLMRKLLYFAAMNMVRRGCIFEHQYQQYLDRGMLKTKALIAIARKLLRIIFAIVRDNSVFDYSRSFLLKEAA